MLTKAKLFKNIARVSKWKGSPDEYGYRKGIHNLHIPNKTPWRNNVESVQKQ